jgi:hypothetical protein
MSLGGANNVPIAGISWSSWGPDSAQGTGSEQIDNCIPDCAQGGLSNDVVTLSLSQPENGIFTMMTIQDPALGTTTTWTYPSLWPSSAS